MKLWKHKQQTGPGSTSAKSLGDSKQRFEIIINNIEDGVMLFDSQLTIQLCNPGASNISGWRTDEASGIDIQTGMTLLDAKGEPFDSTFSPFTEIFKTGQAI